MKLDHLRSLSIFQVMAAGMGCGCLILGILVIGFLAMAPRFTSSDHGQVTLEIEPYLTEFASDEPEESPTGDNTLQVTDTPAWEPPKGKIVYTCFIGGYDDICIMNADGSDQRQLTSVKATDFYASLTPDGQFILFSSRRLEGFQIYRMDLEGLNVTRLTDRIGSLYAPSMSPDGNRIVFTRAREGSQNIWVMGSDGSDPQEITDTEWDDIDPEWSPDGTQISFASNPSGSRQLYVMDADGSNVRKVTPDLLDMGGRNDWSPDGMMLVFYAGPKSDHDIYIINLDGTDLRQLTDGGDNLGPSFSPDGAWIAFTSYRDGNNEIYVMRVDGSQVTRLTSNQRPEWQPRWGP